MSADLAPVPAAFAQQDDELAAVFRREARRLRSFIRSRVADAFEADDIVQEAFFELIAATRVAVPIEHVGAWLFRVAANRITDGFRRRATAAPGSPATDRASSEQDEALESLVSSDAGPEASYANRVLARSLEAALAELPPEQREVFIAHELEGRSFKSLAAESGVGINTLLARKRYAVLHLRRRLRDFQNDEPVTQEV